MLYKSAAVSYTRVWFLFVVVLITMCCGASTATAQWVRQTNIPSPYDTNYWLDVFFLPANPNYGWVCGFNSAVLRTTDGGQTWQGVTLSGENLQLESIHFVNTTVGYTSGGGQILRTTDGGQTWVDVSPSSVIGGTFSLWGCYFVSPDTGVVIGGGCAGDSQNFYRTTDGGQTWSVYRTNIQNVGMTDALLFSGTGQGYASGSGTVWETLNGGQTWALLFITGTRDWQEEITNIGSTFLLPVSGSACGGDETVGGMRMTVDNGQSWRRYLANANMYGAFLLDSMRGWVCGGKGSAYYTPDGGKLWRKLDCGINPTDDLDDIWFINDSLGWVVGNSIYKLQTRAALPTHIVVTGATTFCEGGSIVLTAPKGYRSYQWSNGETVPVITVRQTGTYFLTAVDSLGCPYTFDTVRVEVRKRPVPSIAFSGSLNFCIGDSVELEAPSGYQRYEWSNGATTRRIAVRESGALSVTVTDAFGCKGTSNTVDVAVHMIRNQLRISLDADDKLSFDSAGVVQRLCRPIVIANINDTASFVLTTAFFAGNTLFSLPQHQLPVTIPPADSVVLTACYTPSRPSVEFDTLIVPDNCSQQRAVAVASGKPTVLHVESSCNLTLELRTIAYDRFILQVYPPFPTPATETVRIPIAVTMGNGEAVPLQYSLCNQLGIEVAKGEFSSASAAKGTGYAEMVIGVQHLPQGLYFASIRTPYGSAVVPVSVQR